MSCVLYNLPSYKYLTGESQLLRQSATKVFGKPQSDESLAEWMFALNVDAYCYRYARGDNSKVIDEKREESAIDYEFITDDTRVRDLEASDDVADLLKRVRYQCADVNPYNPDQVARYQQLQELLDTVAQSETAEQIAARRRERYRIAEAAHQAEVELHRSTFATRYPWAKKDKRGNPDPAKNLKYELQAAFPGTKFSVRRDGNSLDVCWIDGAALKDVEALANQYKCGRFDGMDDSYKTSRDPQTIARGKVLGSASYVNCDRQLSPDVLAVAADWYAAVSGKLLSVVNYNDGTGHLQGGDWHDDNRLYTLLNVTPF